MGLDYTLTINLVTVDETGRVVFCEQLYLPLYGRKKNKEPTTSGLFS